MKHYKFKKDQDHYKKDEILEVEKENKLLKEWVEKGIVEKTTKPKGVK